MKFLQTLLVVGLSTSVAIAATAGADREFDIVVYGGTSGGVAAAVQAKRMGKTVALIEPTHRLGGLTTGGLGQTDIGNKMVIGGISREFYERIHRHYRGPLAWTWQKRSDYRDGGQSRTSSDEQAMWTFEPSAALKVMNDLVLENGVVVFYKERLNLNNGVQKVEGSPGRIRSIRMESGRVFRGNMFIDATYEGDLMAEAAVSYTVGREANDIYGETLNGVQTANARHHQLVAGVDPYIVSGDPKSGLLPGVDPNGPGEEGSGDHRVQTYCFRMCLTDEPKNRRNWMKPEGYNELEYELLFRNFEAGFDGVPWHNSAMPNRKTDINNNFGFSTDYIGQNYAYPDANYATREAIVRRHRVYQQGLMWTLANHSRVPKKVRAEISKWGPCKDEFDEGGGWQEQLYIREARRLVGSVVMTQQHCQERAVAEDSIGMAAYTMDSHNVQRYVDQNLKIRNEGDVQVGGFPPFPVSYRSIVPKSEECENLLVPVCLSASHIAFGSIRMEPVFMVLGQSAATAAVHAIEGDVAVQNINFERLEERLMADGQVLSYSPPPREITGIDPKRIPGIVIDDDQSTTTRNGFNHVSTSVQPFVGSGYRTDSNAEKGGQRIRFRISVPKSGRYEVRLAYTAHPNRATNVPVVVNHGNGKVRLLINQQEKPAIDKMFVSLGVFRFEAEESFSVEILNDGTDGYVIADAVTLIER